MKNALILLPVLFLFVACCAEKTEKPVVADKNLYQSLEDDLWLPFDTTKVLEMMDIKLSGNEIDRLGDETIEGLSDEWDTLELTYIAFACSCPNWTLMEEYNKHPESRSSMDFPYGYYLEPANPHVKISDRLHSPTVRVIGKLYNEQGVPDESPVGPGWPVGKKFRYYAYEVVTPVQAIGPMVHVPGKQGETTEFTHFMLE